MAKLNKSQSSKYIGKARSTIDDYIKSGRLSTEQSPAGTVIDTAELERVFGPPPAPTSDNNDTTQSDVVERLEMDNTSLRNKIDMLESEVRTLNRLTDEKETTIGHMEKMADRQEKELERIWNEYGEQKDQIKLLTAPDTESPKEEKVKWRWFGLKKAAN